MSIKEYARVYLLENEGLPYYYVGVTTKSLHERLRQHIRDSRKTARGFKHYFCSCHPLVCLGEDGVKISLLEEFEVVNNQTKNEKEKKWIDELDTEYMLNMRKDRVYSRDEKASSIMCECGGRYTKAHRLRHMVSEKHKRFNQNKD